MGEFELAAYARGQRGRMMKTAYVLTGDRYRAEDLVQATLLRLLGYSAGLDPDRNVDAYVRRVMESIHASWWRTSWRREQPAYDLPLGAAPDDADRIVERARLDTALSTLPDGQRSVVVLRYLVDLSERDVATALGCSVGNVKSQAARGLERLRRYFDAAVSC
jgi:RNA polymerase sigma-70 factor (sigma-E family)